jgi:hypothetical protein
MVAPQSNKIKEIFKDASKARKLLKGIIEKGEDDKGDGIEVELNDEDKITVKRVG